MSESPFIRKSYEEIHDDLLNHIVDGHVVNYMTATAAGTGPYTVHSDTDEPIVEIKNVLGIRDGSFTSFIEIQDYTVDYVNNTITFVSGKEPDNDTTITVYYVYDQGYTSGLSDTSSTSALTILTAAVARSLNAIYEMMEEVRESGWVETAEGDDLNELVKLVGITRNAATKASGYVMFYRDTTSGQQTVTQGTVVATLATDRNVAVRFQTTEAGVFQDGFASVVVPVEASTGFEGTQGNVAANRVRRILSTSVASRVNNPSDIRLYEILDLIDGKYTYQLSRIPKRTMNTVGSIVMVTHWLDEDVSDWTTSNATIDADTPEVGVTKITNDGGEGVGYITYDLTGLTKSPEDYAHIIIRVRGTPGNVVTIAIDTTGDAIEQDFSLTLDWQTLVLDVEALVIDPSDDYDNIKIYPKEAGSVIYVDFVGLGEELAESTAPTPPTVDEFVTNYSRNTVSLYYVSASDNFFDTYSENDWLLVDFISVNHMAGGAAEESDDNLRLRAQTALEIQAKGTKSAIQGAVLEIDGITQCEITDWNDDPSIEPGRIEVAVLSEGFVLSPALEAAVIATVDDTRAAGIRADIFQPLVRYINFTFYLIYDDTREDFMTLAGLNALRTTCVTIVNDYFASMTINRDFYFSDLLGVLIRDVDGVIGGYVNWTDVGANNLEYSDDDYTGTYTYSATIFQDSPQRVNADEEGASVVVQRGNRSPEETIKFEKMTDK